MTDIRIATDYLQDLFAKLAAGRQNPARADWPFAAECWRAVVEDHDQLRQTNNGNAAARDDWAEAYLRLCTETGRVPVLTWEGSDD